MMYLIESRRVGEETWTASPVAVTREDFSKIVDDYKSVKAIEFRKKYNRPEIEMRLGEILE